jgi:cobaltochelatase CobS
MKKIQDILGAKATADMIREGYKKQKGAGWDSLHPALLNGVAVQLMFREPNRATEFVLAEDLFGFPMKHLGGEDVYIERYIQSSEYSPEMPRNWRFNRRVVLAIIAALKTRIPLALTGEPGTGKSEGLEAFYAALNDDVMIIQFTEETEVADLLGVKDLEERNKGVVTVNTYGPIPKSFSGNMRPILNELDYIRPGVMGEGQTFLRSNEINLKAFGGEIVKRGADVIFSGTMNTKGAGDMSGRFGGAQPQNIASLNRWMFEKVTYPSFEDEVAIIQSAAPSLAKEPIEKIVHFAEAMRASYAQQGGVPVPFGVRSTVDSAVLSEAYMDLHTWVRMIMINKLDEESHVEAVLQMYSSVFGATLTKQLQDSIAA